MSRLTIVLSLLLISSATLLANDQQPTQPGRADIEAMLATADRSAPAFLLDDATDQQQPVRCCKICTKGKACGDTCIPKWKTCHVGPGCACNR